MLTPPYILPSKQIRNDGIYFLLRLSKPDSPSLKHLEESYFFDGIALSQNGKFFNFSHSFTGKEWMYKGNGIIGILKICADKIANTPENAIYPPQYEVSYHAHNIVANYRCPEYEETIVCTLYSTNQIMIEEYLNHLEDNFIEERGKYVCDFISLSDINRITEDVANSLYPKRKKKRWWQL
ncbi:MAG: hypothetical protein JJE22_04895 [Bacteroidia bacterium]|nr:hypothetical protein [Bacteroidia bacterium]